MKRIMIIAIIGSISFVAGYFIAKRRTEKRLEHLLDEMGDLLDQSTELLAENNKYMEEVFGPLDDDDDKEDFCYDE